MSTTKEENGYEQQVHYNHVKHLLFLRQHIHKNSCTLREPSLAVVPLVLTKDQASKETEMIWTAVMFAAVALAVFLFVRVGMIRSCYNRLLQMGELTGV